MIATIAGIDIPLGRPAVGGCKGEDSPVREPQREVQDTLQQQFDRGRWEIPDQHSSFFGEGEGRERVRQDFWEIRSGEIITRESCGGDSGR